MAGSGARGPPVPPPPPAGARRKKARTRPMTDNRIDFTTGAPVAGSLDVSWIHGSPARRRASDPPLQVHRYDPHTVIVRESKSVNYEAPFLYLLFGNDRALLLDTGATADPAKFPLRATVDRLIAGWLAPHPLDTSQLVVAHTHGHNDHVAGDAQLRTGRGPPWSAGSWT